MPGGRAHRGRAYRGNTTEFKMQIIIHLKQAPRDAGRQSSPRQSSSSLFVAFGIYVKKTGDLYIADAYFGLIKVVKEGGLATSLASDAYERLQGTVPAGSNSDFTANIHGMGKATILILPNDVFGNNISSTNEEMSAFNFVVSASYENGSVESVKNITYICWNAVGFGFIVIKFVVTTARNLLLNVEGENQTLNGSPLQFEVNPGAANSSSPGFTLNGSGEPFKVFGDLYIADAYFGLMKVVTEGGLATSLASEAEGFQGTVPAGSNSDITANVHIIWYITHPRGNPKHQPTDDVYKHQATSKPAWLSALKIVIGTMEGSLFLVALLTAFLRRITWGR
ncbi:hypothetical protein QYF36_012488 [Acer negundo]|nr:hypothetical protein QYF36_012488 [Acer negundo]